MPECRCRCYGNQHGSWFSPCDRHWDVINAASAALGVSPAEFISNAVNVYVVRMFTK